MTLLTEAEVDALEAGRELDALLAEYLFNYAWIDPVRFENNNMRMLTAPDRAKFLLERGCVVADKQWERYADWDTYVPYFSTTWDGMGQVWAKMPEAKALDEAGGIFSARFHCEWGAEGWELGYYAVGDTAPLAICKAALKVVMLG